MKPITHEINGRKEHIIWQGCTDGENVPETALLISAWSDTITIKQGADEIGINYETIEEFRRVLKVLNS